MVVNSSQDFSDDNTRQNAILLKNQGNDFYKQARYQDAIECYKKALEIDPQYQAAWNNLGLAFLKLGQIEDAKKCQQVLERLQQLTKQEPATIKPGKNPVLAAILSLIPGLGLVYNGQWGKGLLILLITAIAFAIVFPVGIIIWILNIVYSYVVARHINRGLVPYTKSKTLSYAGFLVIAGILLIGAMVIPSVITMASANHHIIEGINIISTVPPKATYSDIVVFESAKANFQEASRELKGIEAGYLGDMKRFNSTLFIAEAGILVCDANIAGARAVNHHERMNAFLVNRAYQSAKTEALNAKSDYETLATIVDQSKEIQSMNIQSLPQDQQPIIADFQTVFAQAKRFKEYVPLMDAYSHYCAAQQYNVEAGSYLMKRDTNSAMPYFDLQDAELRQAIPIAEPLQNSDVPEISEAAKGLVKTARNTLS